MTASLTQQSYGKSRIRLTKIIRHEGRHDLRELSIDITLHGDFERSYTCGDNSLIIPTDTMKNVVLALAYSHAIDSIEDFGSVIAGHFLEHHAHVSSAVVRLEEQPLDRICVDGREHPHGFFGMSSERRTSKVTSSRDGVHIESGLEDLFLLKTTGSSFCGFLIDRYTTLKDAPDRILATILEAKWLYGGTVPDWNALRTQIRRSLLESFANHNSLSVQQTLHAMGKAIIDGFPAVEMITLNMPNKHRILADLKPFGLENANEVFVATDEPYGLITGTLSREESPGP